MEAPHGTRDGGRHVDQSLGTRALFSCTTSQASPNLRNTWLVHPATASRGVTWVQRYKAIPMSSASIITSSSVKEPWPGLILSGVMRSGVASLLKSLSIELAPYGIRVNNIAPGNIMTSRLQKLIVSEAGKAGISFDQRLKERQATIPLARIGDVQEFGRTGAFLLSPAASYITGQTVLVDGGMGKFMY